MCVLNSLVVVPSVVVDGDGGDGSVRVAGGACAAAYAALESYGSR